jgi:hypothetical protein
VTDPPENTAGAAAKGIRLSRGPGGGLHLTLGNGKSFADVRAVLAAPLSQPNRYISFLDSAGQEICLIRDLSDLAPADRLLLEEDLRARYLTSMIRRVVSVRREAAILYCKVDTDRGPRELVIQNSEENVRWLSQHRVLLIDVDGNRFEVSDLHALDKRSARMLVENL